MGTGLIERLESEGWVRQFTASGNRLQEAVESYREIGFEVRTVPVKDLKLGDCTVCFDDENDETMMIFTRAISDDDEK
ncbi:MAG: hypothetical protein GY841_21830 [FCB group bacterium]|nr:hypothetical protein [FCB group bacterium]